MIDKEELLISLDDVYRFSVGKRSRDLLAYKQIVALIEASKEVTEDWIEEWCSQIVGIFWWHKEDGELKSHVTQMLRDLGISIAVDKVRGKNE
jgi:hypothetical protein